MGFSSLTVEPTVAVQSAPAPGSVLANLDRIRADVDSYVVPVDPQDLNECEACQ